jgi:hypothetical protein
MGVYDTLRCKAPLPGVENGAELEFQTKDTPVQYLDSYEIREDGCLFHEAYDVEDHSDPNAASWLERCRGMHTRVNQRWEFCEDFTGEIVFYNGDLEFSSYFVNGKLKELHGLGHD